MSNYAIVAENLSKQYFIENCEREDLPQKTFTNIFQKLGRAEKQGTNLPEEGSIWALQKVNFRVKKGQSLGIIGMNGSGKTTLLRILTRITEPTDGRAIIDGNVSSLLEVGTGFHPELTGKENIYVNGVLLGMTKSEISKKMDDIVNFAGIEKFIETPVKRYSSGMQLRLAFSIAAHIEPDIILVDEVLAVGDILFQDRCLKKMKDLLRAGRTILYVSHNLPSIANLCDRAIILDKGRVISDGPAKTVVAEYIKIAAENEQAGKKDDDYGMNPLKEYKLSKDVTLSKVSISQNGQDCSGSSIDIAKSAEIEICYKVTKSGLKVVPGLHIHDEWDNPILATIDSDGVAVNHGKSVSNTPHQKGYYVARCEFPANFFNDKRYSITVVLLELPNTNFVFKRNALAFEVLDSGEMRKSSRYYGEWMGVVRPKLLWHTCQPPQQSSVIYER